MKKDSFKEKILKEKIANFNPIESGELYHGIFGLPFNVEESKLVLIPVPWEATTTYGDGAAHGPKFILDASQQIDLYDPIYPNGWKEGIAMQDIPSDIFYKSEYLGEKTNEYLGKYNEKEIDGFLRDEINKECENLNKYVNDITSKFLDDGKIVGVVGGEHSVPLGYFKALSKKYKSFGILHIDAHCDLRNAYQGLTYSHASIFYNVLKIKNISKLVQVGVRDFCEEEFKFIKKSKKRVSLFTDYEIKKEIFKGATVRKEFSKIIKELPKNVYISFDIDGLIPYLSPNTGTPVIGGFTIEEMVFLFEELLASGRKIIGFDLCEVSPGKDITNQWDGNVGARVLYKLCLFALRSQ